MKLSVRASPRASRRLIGVALGALVSCRGVSEGPRPASLGRESEAYVKLVAALGERDPDSLDFYAGPPAWLERVRAAPPPLGSIRNEALDLVANLRSRSDASSDRSRRLWLAGQLSAIAARVDVLTGARWGFDEESRRLFGVDPGSRGRLVFEGVRRQIEALLPGSGTLASRVAALGRRYVVPAERVPTIMTSTVEECRRRTLEHFDLPRDEYVGIEYVREMPWAAFTRYQGRGRSVTQINQDFALTVDQLVEIACHETYPGHHTINLLIDQAAQPLFSPLTFHTEGAASFAPALAFSDSSRLAFERTLCRQAGLSDADLERYLTVARLVDRLRWIQVDIARRYLDGDLEFIRAGRALEEEALVPEASTEGMLKFFNRFRTYSVTYTAGLDAVEKFVGTSDEASRWRAFRQWIGP